jgi:hypothetical protein
VQSEARDRTKQNLDFGRAFDFALAAWIHSRLGPQRGGGEAVSGLRIPAAGHRRGLGGAGSDRSNGSGRGCRDCERNEEPPRSWRTKSGLELRETGLQSCESSRVESSARASRARANGLEVAADNIFFVTIITSRDH